MGKRWLILKLILELILELILIERWWWGKWIGWNVENGGEKVRDRKEGVDR
jgi:hypothetical protein